MTLPGAPPPPDDMSDGIPPPLDSSARPWSPDPSSTPGRPLTPTKDLTPSSPLTDVVGRQSDALKGVSSTPPPLAPPTDEPELAADAGVTVEMEACSPSPPSSSAAEQPTSPRPDAAACQGGASDDASPAQLLHAPPRVELELAADARPAVCHGARALPLAQTHVEHHAPARTFALVVVPDACWPSGASESPGSLCWFACVSSSCGYVGVERPYRYEWFQDQVCLPVMIRIFVSSAVSSYLRSYLRLETAKSMAFEARAATSARSRRAPER